MINRDKTIKLAREAGFCWPNIQTMTIEQRLERFAALVAAAEREACAQECKFDRSAADIEISIRARGGSMNTLSFDSHRCAPLHPDTRCRECLRFDRLPGQTWGERTPCVSRSGSQDNGCTYIPIRSKA